MHESGLQTYASKVVKRLRRGFNELVRDIVEYGWRKDLILTFLFLSPFVVGWGFDQLVRHSTWEYPALFGILIPLGHMGYTLCRLLYVRDESVGVVVVYLTAVTGYFVVMIEQASHLYFDESMAPNTWLEILVQAIPVGSEGTGQIGSNAIVIAAFGLLYSIYSRKVARWYWNGVTALYRDGGRVRMMTREIRAGLRTLNQRHEKYNETDATLREVWWGDDVDDTTPDDTARADTRQRAQYPFK